ncbi:MAG TPA: CapA family protein [Candidatus Dormibacteraeota bacterium]|nr:CapA family protein [Candidatus Dormibacteraeota bacterium]
MEVIALVGDVMLGRLVNEALRRAEPASPWGDVLPLLRAADWRCCNLECVVSDLVPPRLPDKAFHFRSDGANVAVLAAAGIDAVSNANNHSLDCGPHAMLDMLERLDRAGIAHAGAGAGLAEARRAALAVTRAGTRIALISCTDNEPGWAAGVDTPGLHHVPCQPDDPAAQALTAQVRELRSLADIVIVSLHWGGNWGWRPPLEHRVLGRALVQAGADIVLGHSCHVFRGIEVAGRGVIIYSAGDFVDDYAVDEAERNDWSFVFSAEVVRGRVTRLRLRPTVIRELQACLAAGPLARQIIDRMCELCQELATPVDAGDKEAVIEVAAPDGHRSMA